MIEEHRNTYLTINRLFEVSFVATGMAQVKSAASSCETSSSWSAVILRLSDVPGLPNDGKQGLRRVQGDPTESNGRSWPIMSMPAVREAPLSLSDCAAMEWNPKHPDDALSCCTKGLRRSRVGDLEDRNFPVFAARVIAGWSVNCGLSGL